MSSQKVMDMTKGPVLSQMTRFALPVLLGMLCQRIYNFADTYIVGRFLGDEALAAVSIAGTAMYLLFSVMMGVTTGVSVVITAPARNRTSAVPSWQEPGRRQA